MLAAYVPHLSGNGWNSEFEDKVLGGLSHELGEADAVFARSSLLPLVAVDLGDGESLQESFCHTADLDVDFASHEGDYTSKGVAEGLVKSCQLFDEVEAAIPHQTYFVH